MSIFGRISVVASRLILEKTLTRITQTNIQKSTNRGLKLWVRQDNNFSNNNYNYSFRRNVSSGERAINEDNIPVTFIKPDGTKTTVIGNPGKSLYDLVIDNDLDIDGFGACEGTLCCTTCHLIFEEECFRKYGEPGDEELDMLDLAYGLTETSRLGCQVILKKGSGPLEVHVPQGVSDIRADG